MAKSTKTKTPKPQTRQVDKAPARLPVLCVFISSRRVAEAFDCSLQTARRIILREKLGRKIGGRFKVRVAALMRYDLEACRSLGLY
jgi:hypothetical protein